MQYVRVDTLAAVFDALEEPGAHVLAGGTDLVVKIRGGLVAPSCLIDISHVEDLRGVSTADGHIDIGAATPEQELVTHPLVRERLPLLAHVLGNLGSVQIRNRGTLGGNLVNASPAADSAIPLLLYNAELVLRMRDEERVLPLSRFFIGPGACSLQQGEIVQTIRVPLTDRQPKTFFHKVGRRRALTISIASVGGFFWVEGTRVREARLAAGSVARVPMRLTSVEKMLEGAVLTEEAIVDAGHAAAAAVSPISDVRASAEYRRDVVADLVARALRSAAT